MNVSSKLYVSYNVLVFIESNIEEPRNPTQGALYILEIQARISFERLRTFCGLPHPLPPKESREVNVELLFGELRHYFKRRSC